MRKRHMTPFCLFGEQGLEKPARLRDAGTIAVIKMGDIGEYRCR